MNACRIPSINSRDLHYPVRSGYAFLLAMTSPAWKTFTSENDKRRITIAVAVNCMQHNNAKFSLV